MDFHQRMAIVHTLHTFWNPISEDAVDDLVEALDLPPNSRVLDIACGVGELLIRIAERYGCSGVGVDISDAALEQARVNASERVEDALEFVESDGASFATEERFDLVCLVGASWIWKGYRVTLDALKLRLKPGGLMLFGEPYWRVPEPPDEYCEIEGVTRETFTTLDGIREAAARRGLRLVYMVGSTDRDWDRYEMLQSLAADRWARLHPDDPDLEEVLRLTERSRMNYLRHGRDVLGFAQFVFRAPVGQR
jgi:SAM-dependent methyltransferase